MMRWPHFEIHAESDKTHQPVHLLQNPRRAETQPGWGQCFQQMEDAISSAVSLSTSASTSAKANSVAVPAP